MKANFGKWLILTRVVDNTKGIVSASSPIVVGFSNTLPRARKNMNPTGAIK